jgi:hypothetical protein
MKQYLYFIKTFLLLLGVTVGGMRASAQIAEGGAPASFDFREDISLRSVKSPHTMPISFDVAALLEEDSVSEAIGLMPRTSVIIPADLDMDNAGEWSVLPNGIKIWRTSIKAPDAIAVMLYYDRFFIPDGGKLFIYNADRTHLLGAYTASTNPGNKKFATEFVAGDEIILEYNEPLNANDHTGYAKPDIQISGIGYGYNHLEVYQANNPFLDFGKIPGFFNTSCQVNINCPEGNDWQDQKKGVAKSVAPVGTGGYLCSGSLVNNTAQDLTPYYLTAHHCFEDTGISFDQILFYFHYESPDCSTTTPPSSSKTVVGAQMLVDLPIKGSSDGVLMKLNSNIPEDYDVFYNGWDRRNTAAASGAGIHHPKGDIKKIATYTSPVISSRWSGSDAGAADAHWKVDFAKTQSGYGQTEGGSSGSPLFNQAGLIVGTLTGGTAANCNTGSTNYYGKLWYHWDNANIVSGSTKMMKDYLDPLNTGAQTLEGIYNAVTGNTHLKSLTVNSGELVPLFSAFVTNYTVKVASNTERISVSATAAEAGATVTGTGNHQLNPGNNTIRVVVTSPDKSTSRTYTITVVRPIVLPADKYEPNNTLGQAFSLPVVFKNDTATVVTTGSNFHNETDIDFYKIDLPQGYNYIIFAQVYDLFNGYDGCACSVDAKFACSTDGGNNWSDEYDDFMQGNIIIRNGGTVYFRVSPYFAGDVGDYLLEVNVERKQAGENSNAGLSALSIDPGNLSPAFNTNRISYMDIVGNSVGGVIVTATASDANAIVSGVGYHPITDGNNIIPVVVTAQNGKVQNTYTITLIRRAIAGNNANLQSMTINQGSLFPRFNGNITNYRANVSHNITTVNVSATAADQYASVKGTGDHPLNAGENEIDVVVTAENGSVFKTYQITVVRELPNGIEDTRDTSLKASPNPAREQIIVSGLKGSGVLRVLDVVGRECIRQNILSENEYIAVGSLPAGLYFIQVIEESNIRTLKVVVK